MKFKIELDSSYLKNPKLILKLIAIILLSLTLIYFEVDLVDIVIALYFLISVLFSIQSWYSFLDSLFFLVITAFLSILGNKTVAENYAVFAFYFLAIGTITAVVEAVKNKN